ncbi:peptidase M61 [Isorropodon fossajaponicum endosymbiont JTNG4]|uniref:M61 family metallopeptidase n=1 Tax=Isorropodon fossajaponicum symbiont TaxID=883811 RepID=UPI0019155F6F|nr:PDZ domain-containing protein [Isorropodon fossajaponicum symbiont]BBB23604.1 peptidase M61 [Isorropodon fossajaponicum endosymbiont JTNG4]
MSIQYTVAIKDIHAHIFKVVLTLKNPNSLGQVFSLPNWIPGSYLIRDFAKNIISIKAKSHHQQVPIKKLDKNHWISYPCENILSIEYEVYAFDLSVRSAYLDNERAFFNGSSLFLLPLGFESDLCELNIKPANQTLDNWSCATGLTALGNMNFIAHNYQDLIDHPVEMAAFTKLEFDARGISHKMAITGKHNADIKRLTKDLAIICTHHIDFFNGVIPFDEYLFLTLVRANAYGGLEHKNSSSLICSRKEMPVFNEHDITPEYTRFLALCSHEYFHTWWIKTIKPASFHQLDLNAENYTQQLWIFEGFTSYYDELSLLRVQILTPKQYLILFAQTITRVQQSKGRQKQSLAESSYDTWTKFYQQDENAPNAIVSYYTKGALLAFVLDINIRQRTNDKASLDDVLKFAWENYQEFGLKDNTIQCIVNDLVKADLSDFFNDYLYGVKELPLQETFAYVGVDCVFSINKKELSNFGISVNTKGEFVQITTVFSDTCAQKYGLYVGDKIITINHEKVSGKSLVAVINQYAANEIIKVGVLRDELLLEISVNITDSEKTFCTLSIQNDLSAEILERQKKWFSQAK